MMLRVCAVLLMIVVFGCDGPVDPDNGTTTTTSVDAATTTTTTAVADPGAYPIVDTNQSNCHDESDQISCPDTGEGFYGQDAQYEANIASYKNNGDGTITDLNTGLMWQKDPGEKVSYDEAVANLEGFSLAGYTDWRIPTIKELYSLMNFNGQDISGSEGNDTSGLTPFIDTDYFAFYYGDTSAGQRLIDSQWVTGNINVSKVMNNQECFFGVNFADGRIKCYPTQTGGTQQGYYAIYVRGDEYGVNTFTDNNDDTVTDEASGLMWQKNDSGEGMVWEDALGYCEDLSLANYTDWRLPNAKELQSIVDYTKSPDATGTAAIESVFSITSINNEGGEKDYPYYWTSTTHMNFINSQYGAYISFGRGLGYMAEHGGWIDVHGAGCQRSDPKVGNPDDYPTGHGPQGDAIRIYNYVRCVRGGDVTPGTGDEPASGGGSTEDECAPPAGCDPPQPGVPPEPGCELPPGCEPPETQPPA